MKVALIVVNYNDTENTVKFIEKISKYNIINRIVVVDNCSTTANSMELLNNIKDEKIVVIKSDKNGGYSYGNNYGIRYLESKNEQYDYLIISNPDIDIEIEAIENCLQVLENDSDIGIIAPRMYNSENKPIRRSSWKIRTFLLDVIHSTRLLEVLFYGKLRAGEYLETDYKNDILEVEAISGAFFITRYDLFKKIGMFDENVFLFYEEDILAHKLKSENKKIVSLNNEKFMHFESQTIGKSFSYYKKMRQLYKSKMYYHTKYTDINRLQKLIFAFLNLCRKIELIIEIPLRKILKK